VLFKPCIAYESKNRLSFLADIADKNSLAGIDWMMELSKSEDLGFVEISGEYSLLSRLRGSWDDDLDADITSQHYRYYLSLNRPPDGIEIGLAKIEFRLCKSAEAADVV